jgi:hypothetical protein
MTPHAAPSPVVQTMTYMLAVLGGWLLATPGGEWARGWARVRALVRPASRSDEE